MAPDIRREGVAGEWYTMRKLLLVCVLVLCFTILVGAVSAASVTIIDDAGPDDEPGQKDLSQMTVDFANLPTSMPIGWQWDDTAFSGSNTGDACSLFDTNSNGFADYSLCVGVNGEPATQQYLKLYSCADSHSDRCYSSVEDTLFSSTCNTDIITNSGDL